MRLDPVKAARLYLRGLTTLHLHTRVGDDALDRLLARCPPRSFPRGVDVYRQGEPAHDALLVVQGQLDAQVQTPQGPRTIGRIGAWDVIGEVALYVPRSPRSATVRARRLTTGLQVTPALFADGWSDPTIVAIEHHMMHTISQRIRATNRMTQDLPGEPPAATPLLPPQEPPPEVLERCPRRLLEAGTRLCAEGEAARSLFFLLEGEVVVTKHTAGTERVLARVAAPEVLGLMGLVDRVTRTATLTVTRRARVATLDMAHFTRLSRRTDPVGAALRTSLLRSLSSTMLQSNLRLGAALDGSTEPPVKPA